MSEKNDLMTLKTTVSDPVAGVQAHDEGGRAARRSATRTGEPSLLGLFAVGFAGLSIFMLAPVFVPLGLILGVIALLIGQVGYGIAAILLSVVGIVTSPALMALVGFGAFFAWLGI